MRKTLLLFILVTSSVLPQNIINKIPLSSILKSEAQIKSISCDNARPFNIILNLTDSSIWSINSEENQVVRIKNNDKYFNSVRSSHNPDILYTGKNLVLRSLDNGKKWEKLSDTINNIRSITESAVKFGLLYVVDSSNNVFVTENSGYTWNKLDSSFAYVLPSRHNVNNIYAVIDSTLLVSNNNGNNWKLLNNNLGNLLIISEDPANPNLLYAVINNEPYLSYDFGITFSIINGNLPKANFKGLVVHPRDNKLITSTDSLIYIIDINSYKKITPKVLTSNLNILDIVKESDVLNCYYFSKEKEKIVVKIMYKDEVIFEEDLVSQIGLNNYLYNYTFNKRKHYLVNLSKQRRAIVKDRILSGKYKLVLESEERKVEKEFYVK